MKRVTEDAPVEQVFAQVEALLAETEEMLLPRIEAGVRDVREVCNRAYDVLIELEDQVLRQSQK